MIKQKVLFVTGSQAKSGGTERACASLVNALVASENFQLTVLSAVDGRRSFFDIHPGVALDEIYTKPRSLQAAAIDFTLKLRHYLERNPQDVIVVVETFLAAFVLPATLGLKAKVVAWEHFGAHITLGVPVRRLARRLAAHYCAHVVVLTNADREAWQAKYCIDGQRISTIQNINPMHHETVQASAAKRDKVVLAVGRLVPEKGYDLLLQAWAKVRPDARFGWRLRIVGDGGQKAELERLACQLSIAEQVDFVPRKLNVADEYRRAGIFALPSRFEGFGLVLVEAMSFGLPVVSFDCPYGPREILQNRATGVLVPPMNVSAFAMQLERLMGSPDRRFSLGVRGRATLIRYDPAVIAAQWSRLLCLLAASPLYR